ncbi:YdcF family protein [Alkalinema pantanalense CENA528]|uniref:YdcF family protein n=1 Tax=Alkalinema pantanalense TaxID=1620705 RepID=UPI003D6EDE44
MGGRGSLVFNRRQLQRRAAKRAKLRFPWWVLFLPILVGLGYRQVQIWFTQPQAVLVLGGEPSREKFAAKFAQEHPQLPIWISSGAPREYAEWVFGDAGVNLDRVHLDYRAVDTLTNFTTLADELQAKGIRNIYLVTSDYHMRRASLIGEIVLGSRGIIFHPVKIESVPPKPEESMAKTIRDGGRAVLWVTTGYTGADLKATNK